VIRIMIVEEMGLLRGALVAVLGQESDFQIVADIDRYRDVRLAAGYHRPDIVLMGVDVADEEPLSLVERLHAELPECAVVVLTGQQTALALQRALRAQVRGFIGKDVAPDELVRQLRTIAAGHRVIDPVAALAALNAAVNPLTSREREVIGAAARGMRSKEIARELYLAPGTVRNHLSAVLRKTGARNRWEAIQRAQDAGWI